MPLTPLRERFVEEYLSQPGSAAAAYRRASGRDTKSANVEACKLLQHPKIQEAIERRQAHLRDRYDYTRDHAYHDLRAVIDNAQSTAMEKLKATELLCRLFGLFPKPARQSPSTTTTQRPKQPNSERSLQTLSDEELTALLTQ